MIDAVDAFIDFLFLLWLNKKKPKVWLSCLLIVANIGGAVAWLVLR